MNDSENENVNKDKHVNENEQINEHVKANLNEWPFFSIQIARGSKNHTLNPVAPIPRGEATPVRGFQFHQEFEKQW